MFQGLKQKFSSVRKTIGNTLEEIEPVQKPVSPDDSPGTKSSDLVGPCTDKPIVCETDDKKSSKFNENASFLQKVSTLVKDREFIISAKNLDEPLFELEMVLLENDVALSASDVIITHVREDLLGSRRKVGHSIDDVVNASLAGALLKVLGDGYDIIGYINTHEHPIKILFTGVNGTGKTTTIAKVAHFLTKNGFSVVLGAGDTFRAGAIEQIDVHGERLGLKVIQHQEGSDPSAVLFDTVAYAKAHGIDVVLGDTAGRFHNKVNLMNQLAKIRRVINPDLVLYVDEAVAGNDAVIRAKDFAETVGIDGIVLTKVDMDPKGGAAISIAYAVQKPLVFIGTGQGYDDISLFNPASVVEELLSGDA